MNDPFEWSLPWLLGALVVALLLFIGFVKSDEDAQWKQFAKDHACKLVSTEDGSTAIGFTSKGSMATTYISGHEGFLCDDGVVHYREK